MPASLRENRPVLLLIVAIGLPLLVLFALIQRSLSRFDEAAARMLRQASAQLAEALTQQIHGDFTGTFFTLLEQIDHEHVRRVDLAYVRDHIRSRDDVVCFVDGVYVGTAAPQEVHFFPLTVHRTRDAGVVSDARRASLEESTFLWRKVEQFAAVRRTVGFWDEDVGGEQRHVLLHLLYDSQNRRELDAFLGFTVNHARLRDHYFPEVIDEAVARHRSHLADLPAAPVVSVFDADVEVYRSGRSLRQDYEAELEVPFLFLDTRRFREWRDEGLDGLPALRSLRIRTAYDSGSVATLVRQHTRPQRWLWAAMALLAIGGLCLTARATYREVRLARMKLEFFSRLSHDAKTPLANIRLFADTLKSRPNLSPAKARQYYAILSSQAQHLAHRIGGILDMARTEAGVRTYQLEPMDLKATLQCTVDAFAYELDQANFHCELVLPPGDVTIAGNPDALEQLFGNLVDNAMKYSGADRFLRIRLATDNGSARVDVTDHGIGIPAAEQRKIFRKFYRVHHSAGVPHGSGLGLATVAHVARAHKGRVSVSSEPGGGATFTVHLPLYAHGGRP
jgi:two-component system phosphate regulon sensor histidine kinase PhoR